MKNSKTNMDIDNNRELFEYEMTRVLLQLKGEFSSVSDKDMHFAKDSVGITAILLMPEDIKPISVKEEHVFCPDIPKVEGNEVPKYNLIKPEHVFCPNIPKVERADIPKYDLIKPEILYNIENPKCLGLQAKADIKKHTIELPALKSSCAQFKLNYKKNKESTFKSRYQFKAIGGFSYKKRDIMIENSTCIDIPDFLPPLCVNKFDMPRRISDMEFSLPKVSNSTSFVFQVSDVGEKTTSKVEITPIKRVHTKWNRPETISRQTSVTLPQQKSFKGIQPVVSIEMQYKQSVSVPTLSMTASNGIESIDLPKDDIVSKTEKIADSAKSSFDSLAKDLSSLKKLLLKTTV